ncbi:MAG: hypothetical protein IPN33_09465 [Saprospiraceae bacterium]|nr:hypothetical protein [Saprospiraceae bacterium]
MTNSTDVYRLSRQSFISDVMPAEVLRWPAQDVLDLLEARYGKGPLGRALQPEESVDGPLVGFDNGRWLRSANMVGVNVRTIGSFWQVVKYALTLPACQSAVHLLPFWEPGVVDSLYGMSSWRINTEFFSEELAQAQPHLDTVEKQLKVAVNLLHLMGKAVGMDAIPHTDRYAEIVLANPAFFEWLQRKDKEIVDHSADLHRSVERAILAWLAANGSATPGLAWPDDPVTFFGHGYGETMRQDVLFGESQKTDQRNQRRNLLVQWLFDKGYEPVPATMAPPYRGLEVDPSDKAKTTDSEGRVWRDYRISKPEPMSRVFGPLTRYKFYEALDDNREWAIDFTRPRKEVWEYVCEAYAEVVRTYGLDFMRGDMSHVQMRPAGVPFEVDVYYDIHKAIKARVREEKPWFGYFAETFLAAPGIMAYGDEVDHLEQAGADATLGDLQSMVVGSPVFMQQFRWYLDILATRQVAPSFTLMTGDKDDPRFDEFYLAGNEARLFIALFLTDMPSYMGLGFECRDPHPTPAPNEHYTKLYVFKLTDGDKATRGPYVWGSNKTLFERLTRLRLLAEQLLPEIEGARTQWLLPPDPTAGNKLIAWTQAEHPRYVFVANLNLEKTLQNVKLPALPQRPGAVLEPVALLLSGEAQLELAFNGIQYQLPDLLAGEVGIWRVLA